MKIEYKLNKYQPILETTVACDLEVQVEHASVLEQGELAVSDAKLERLTQITSRLLESLVEKIFLAPMKPLPLLRAIKAS